METILSWLIATIITLPIVGYIIVFVLTKVITKKHQKAVNIASYFSTFLFIVAVHFIIKATWNVSLLWVILLLILLLAMLVVIVHYIFRDEIQIPKVMKGIWKVNGLVFFVLYCILVLTGVTLNVMKLFNGIGN